jgi:hypothetical protein
LRRKEDNYGQIYETISNSWSGNGGNNMVDSSDGSNGKINTIRALLLYGVFRFYSHFYHFSLFILSIYHRIVHEGIFDEELSLIEA